MDSTTDPHKGHDLAYYPSSTGLYHIYCWTCKVWVKLILG